MHVCHAPQSHLSWSICICTQCVLILFFLSPGSTLFPFLIYKSSFSIVFLPFFANNLGFIWRKCHVQAHSVYQKTFMHYEVFFPGSRRMFSVVSTLERYTTATNLGVNGLEAKFSTLNRFCYNLFRSLGKAGTGRNISFQNKERGESTKLVHSCLDLGNRTLISFNCSPYSTQFFYHLQRLLTLTVITPCTHNALFCVYILRESIISVYSYPVRELKTFYFSIAMCYSTEENWDYYVSHH